MAIALGSGDARGIRHVLALEALDETGISPVAIAGRSMSAIIAGAYAARIKGILFGPIIASLKRALRCDEQVVASAAGTFR